MRRRLWVFLSMMEKWFRTVRCEVPWEVYQSLPRHPAYRFEYVQGELRITGRPRFLSCRLGLEDLAESVTERDGYEVHTLSEHNRDELSTLFARAFANTAPFAALDWETCEVAAKALLARTESGDDGRLDPAASLVVKSSATDHLCGVSIVTWVSGQYLFPSGLGRPDEMTAEESRRVVFPHLTWIFVEPESSRMGLGCWLLTRSGRVLREQGANSLYSTFLLGQSESMLWHWKMGFQLLEDPMSPRHWRM
ncbi:MAG: hypothetical protein KDA80_05165 [Planctomycetaceae bacterium]|nr:hypothetical protein [Planctomycetaceae bacterium]